jgi:MFS family permease
VDNGAVDARHYSLRATLRLIAERRCFLAYSFGLGLFCFAGHSFEVWGPAYLLRVYHMSSGDVGAIAGLVEGGAGLIGTLGGGLLADYLGRRDQRWYLWLPMLAVVLMIPSMLLFLHIGGGPAMFFFYAMFVLCGASFLAPMMAITHRLMPLHMRALSSAILFLIMNFVGNGAGPFTVGVLNDLLAPRFGDEAVRYSLTLVVSGAVAGLLCVLYAVRRLPLELSRTKLAFQG